MASRACFERPAFLDGEARHHAIAVASYPRSGSSLTRALLEGLTGVWTGSDFCRNDTQYKTRRRSR